MRVYGALLQIPGAELRKHKLLPYPKKNYNTAD